MTSHQWKAEKGSTSYYTRNKNDQENDTHLSCESKCGLKQKVNREVAIAGSSEQRLILHGYVKGRYAHRDQWQPQQEQQMPTRLTSDKKITKKNLAK